MSVVSFVFCLALLLPQPGEAHHRAQFQRLGLLLTGNLDGLAENTLPLLTGRLGD